jgi:hypothetical protein
MRLITNDRRRKKWAAYGCRREKAQPFRGLRLEKDGDAR